jgi:hypothetical protein
MNDEFVGKVMAFKGDDEYIAQTNVLLEVTEVDGPNVEVAFNFPPVVKGEPRVYVSIPLDELVRRVAEFHQEKKK